MDELEKEEIAELEALTPDNDDLLPEENDLELDDADFE